jgi:hypothetical protein
MPKALPKEEEPEPKAVAKKDEPKAVEEVPKD